jgi:hypothetical protein
MAFAQRQTLLSLDRYAKIMGISPVHFSGANQIELDDGRLLFPIDNAQNNIWPQFSWQNSDQISRDELSLQIALAESDISKYLGFYPAPKWVERERHAYQTAYRPGYTFASIQDSQLKIRLDHGKFINGGKRKVSLIQASVDVVYSDPDGDGFNEIASVTFSVNEPFNIGEVRIYFEGYNGEKTYEIRDPLTITYPAQYPGNYVFKYYAWQMINPAKLTVLPTDDTDGKVVNLNDPTTTVSKVDVYREYNYTDNSCCVMYKPDGTSVNGNLARTGDAEYVLTLPEESISEYTHCELSYYSGNIDVFSPDYLTDDFATAIAYLATARLDRVFFANNNATSFAINLMDDWAITPQGMFKNPPRDTFTNPFGTRRGEVMAWNRISRYNSMRTSGGSL